MGSCKQGYKDVIRSIQSHIGAAEGFSTLSTPTEVIIGYSPIISEYKGLKYV